MAFYAIYSTLFTEHVFSDIRMVETCRGERWRRDRREDEDRFALGVSKEIDWTIKMENLYQSQ